jgi:putative ABC transport system permease protein
MEREMDDELRFHLELETEDLIRSGVEPHEAHRRARASFGGLERFKEEGRDVRGVRWLDEVRNDARYGARQLRRSPEFAIAALITLGLGIGAATMMYSTVRALFVKPFPFANLEQLVFIEQCGIGCKRASIGNYVSIRDEVRSLDGVTAFTAWSPTYRGRESTDVARGTRVTADFFTTVGVAPLRGRTFVATDTLSDAEPVVVVSEAMWRARFGGDSSIVGQSLVLDGIAYTIVGVVPDRYTIPGLTEVWAILPIDAKALGQRYWTDWTVYGRLHEGSTIAQLNAELSALRDRRATEYPDAMQRVRLTAWPLADYNSGAWKPIATFMTAVGFVLVIACINLAGLLLTRLSARQRELAVRAAMGASAARLARQLLTETLMLSAFGGLAGISTAWAFVGIARVSISGDVDSSLPGWSGLGIDPIAFAVALALGILTGLIIGIGPAYRFSRPNLVATLKEGVRSVGGRASRTRRLLIVAEVAFALILVSAAGLLTRSALNAYRADLGFRTDHMLTLRLRHPPEPDSLHRRPTDFYDRLVAEVRTLPGVEDAAAVSFVPLTGFTSFGFDIAGHPWPDGQRPSGRMQAATPGYFELLQIPLRRGRTFNDRDVAHSLPVAIVNENVARRYFAERGLEALGSTLVLQGKRFDVIGVVANVYHNGVKNGAWNEIYYPQQQWPRRDLSLVVRTRDEPTALAPAVTRAIRQFDADIGVNRVSSLETLLQDQLSESRVIAVIMAMFAGIALLISAMGLYGVISYSVSQRTREFGIRLALGARRHELLGLVLGDGIRLAAWGSVLGIAGAFAVMRLIRFMLYGVGPGDPITMVGVIVLLGVITLAASFVPARRATNVDPMTSLRAD